MSPHAIFVNYNDTIVFANQACVKLFGAFEKSQLLGKPMMDFIHPDSQVITQERFARLHSINGSWPSTEEHFVALDGSVIAVEVAATGIKFEGKPAIQVILTHIRARKQLERALVASNLQLETILASATRVSIIAINTEGMITTFNAGATHMLGYTSDEMIGQPMLTALHLPEELAKHTRDMSELYASPIDQLEALTKQARLGGFDEQEWTYRRKSGWVSYRAGHRDGPQEHRRRGERLPGDRKGHHPTQGRASRLDRGRTRTRAEKCRTGPETPHWRPPSSKPTSSPP